MAPRKFNCYMVAIGLGTHPKMADLSDSEVRAHALGVLAVAAMSPVRGHLLVGQVAAGPAHVAAAAGVSPKVAASAMKKLEAIGVLERDTTLGCLQVHDWDDLNPPPKTDRTSAERQKRYRDRHGPVTAPSRRNGTPSDAAVTPPVTPPEVEVEVELPPKPPKGGISPGTGKDEQALFDAWVEATERTSQTVFDAKRRRIAKHALKLFPLADCIDAVRGWRHSPHHRGENSQSTVYNDFALLLRDSAQIEKFRDLERSQRDSGNEGGQLMSFVAAVNARAAENGGAA